MRTTIWPGLCKAVAYNQARQQSRVRLFEIGQCFIAEGDELTQENALAGVISGNRQPESWMGKSEKVDFFDIKGDLESLLSLGGDAASFTLVADQHEALHPGQTARIEKNGVTVGWIGALHPTLQKKLDLAGPIYLFELKLAALVDGRLPRFSSLSKFPESRRDLAMLIDAEVSFEAVRAVAQSEAGEFLKDIILFDVYTGQGIEPGRKSLALGLTWQHPSRTLNDDEINASVQSVVAKLTSELGAVLRD